MAKANFVMTWLIYEYKLSFPQPMEDPHENLAFIVALEKMFESVDKQSNGAMLYYKLSLQVFDSH